MPMTCHDLRNALCILHSLDEVRLGDQAAAFHADPVRFFLRADDETAQMIWAAVEARMTPITAARTNNEREAA